MKYMKLFEEYPIPNLTWREATELASTQNAIKTYFTNVYPNDRDILNPEGFSMSVLTIAKILKFAKKHKDERLLYLMQEHMNKIEELKIKRDAEKYNL